ncbi:MAG: replication initiation protein [Candidatus Contendobacter sp.]|jgi:hypothetical protein|nr:replication initiation protein [Candidatus Contendobacter sp.]
MADVSQLLDNHMRKPTALIHFERELSVIEQKVMTLIIFHCQVVEKDDKGFYYIKKNFVREFLGWDDSNNYPRLYEAFEGIFNNTIQWNVLGADRTFKSLKCKLIISLLEPSETGQYIGFQLHPDLEPAIKDPKVFAKLKLVMLVLLSRSQYAYPLYELFADSYSRGQNPLRLSLATLKTYLGIGAGCYEVFKDFKVRVLKPNLDAINATTDFRVEYQTYREGRVIGGLLFHFHKQAWRPPRLEGPLRELRKYYQQLPLVEALKTPLLSAEEQSFVDELQPYALAESDILQALETHGLEGAMEIRDYVLAEIGRRQGTLEEIRNTGAYLARCFREGYGRKTAEERTAARRQRTAKAIAQSQQQAKEQQRAAIDALITGFRQQQAAQVEARLAAMTDQEREAFDQAFIRAHPIWVKSYRTAGLTSPMLRAALQTFAIPRLLTAEQQDLTGYARAQGASLEILNLLQLSA